MSDVVGFAFPMLWTALALGFGYWSWRRWTRTKVTRQTKWLWQDVQEQDAPAVFWIVYAGEFTGIIASALLVAVLLVLLTT